MTATSRANRQMSLIRTCLVLLITLPALVLQSGSSARANHERRPACPSVANRGEITTTRTDEVFPGERHWYSWKVLPGDHQVWLQGADDLQCADWGRVPRVGGSLLGPTLVVRPRAPTPPDSRR